MYYLPRQTLSFRPADVLQTHGLFQVFNRKDFLDTLDSCYADPLKVNPSWLCLLNLVFAIGLVLATPALGSTDAVVVDKLRKETFDQAEIFYTNAKSLDDPIIGFEDAGFWSIQALHLMAVYMLAVSKRNTAFAYFGRFYILLKRLKAAYEN